MFMAFLSMYEPASLPVSFARYTTTGVDGFALSRNAEDVGENLTVDGSNNATMKNGSRFPGTRSLPA